MPQQKIIVRPFASTDETAVVDLWKKCQLTRPWNDPRKDIARKLKVNPELFLLAELDGRIIGSVMAGYDGHRGWINYLGVLPAHQRSGVGRMLMDEAEKRLREMGCSKINLQVRRGNSSAIEFYKRVGYVEDDVLSFGKRLIDDQTK